MGENSVDKSAPACSTRVCDINNSLDRKTGPGPRSGEEENSVDKTARVFITGL